MMDWNYGSDGNDKGLWYFVRNLRKNQPLGGWKREQT
jgi:hypothetical protein